MLKYVLLASVLLAQFGAEAAPNSCENIFKNGRKIVTPWELEQRAQAEVLSRYSAKSFLQRMRENFLGKKLSESVQIRYETIVYRDELMFAHAKEQLLQRTFVSDYKTFKHRHFNKYQLAKFIIINSVLYSYIGVPLYFPRFDLIGNIEFTRAELELVQKLGYRGAYNILKKKYRLPFRAQQIIEKTPYVFFLSVSALTAYNYFSFKAEENRYQIPNENSIPLENKLYVEWKNKYQELNGRVPDIINNKSDREEWDFIQRVTYRVWVDQFFQENSRYPDLANPSDLGSWNSFLLKMDFQ